MRDELKKLTLKQLKAIVKQYNELNQIKRYSKKTKDDLIDTILEYNILIENTLNNLPTSMNIYDITGEIAKKKKEEDERDARNFERMKNPVFDRSGFEDDLKKAINIDNKKRIAKMKRLKKQLAIEI